MRTAEYTKLLRRYSRVAQKEYKCDHCITHGIYPGELYTGKVYVVGRKVVVEREHFQCPFDPLDEENWNSSLRWTNAPRFILLAA